MENSQLLVMEEPQRRCYACDGTSTKIQKRRTMISPLWIRNYDQLDSVLCARCYDRLKLKKPRPEHQSRCYACDVDSSPVGWSLNYDDAQNVLCHTCNIALIYAHEPHERERQRRYHSSQRERYKKHRRNYADKQITFLGEVIHIDKALRVGVCNLCRAVLGTDCKITHIHHEQYDMADPTKHTIELCPRCHRKITKPKWVRNNAV